MAIPLAAWAVLTWAPRGILLNIAAPASNLLTHTVQPTDLRLTVLESGTLESSSSVTVLSQVEGQVAVISMAPQGSRVRQGDLVVELDSSAFKTRRTEQQIVVEQARAAYSQAKQADHVARSQAESDKKSAELLLKFAEIDQRRYIEGEFPQEMRIAQSEVTLAEEELKRARERLKFSEELKTQGYLSEGQVDADKLTVLRSDTKLELATERVRLLREFTHTRMKEDLDSKVAEAHRALERTGSLAQSSIDQAAAKLRAQEATLSLEVDKLQHIEKQIEKCTMRAPQDGVVVYPVPQDNDQLDLFIKPGTIIRERQHVFSIPDTDVLQVTTRVHEAMVSQVKNGFPARIWIDVFPDLELAGIVEHVSPLPDPDDWRKANVKFYETRVSISEQFDGLRPGMSAKVEILINELPNVLAVPVQSVVQRGRVGYCYVATGLRPELRRLRVGSSNEQFIEVVEGLAAGERVVLSPDVLGVPADVFDNETQADSRATADSASEEKPAGEPVEKPRKKRDKGEKVQYSTELAGTGSATGEIEYEITTIGAEVFKEFEIKIQNGTPGAVLDVAVNDVVIGQVTLDANGAVDFQWSTKDQNFPAGFPAEAGPGSTVTVGDSLTGKLQL